MPPLDSGARRALRARAHHLNPVVAIGQHGLTPAVVHEIHVALRAHELIKIRVLSDDRATRAGLLDLVCNAVDAAPVQHLGKLLVIWRPNPDAPKAGAAGKRDGATARAAGKSPAARKRVAGGGKPTARGRPAAGKSPAASKRPPKGKTGPRSTPAGRRDPRAASSRGRAAAGADEASGSSGRGGTSSAPRTAPPAGVPRASLPRRRRAR
jgi:RNA-binding protein